MPLDANAVGQQQWFDRLKGALTLQPYLNPMQPVDMAKGLWNSLVQYPHDVYTGQQQATPEGATNFALGTFSGGPGMAVRGAVGSAGGRLGAEAMGAAQPAQPWFSALAKGVEAAPVNKASGEQWLGTLKNMPGIKPEELQWTGFQDWLKGKPSVTKQEATDFLNQNQVNLQEVVKGKPDTAELDALTMKQLSSGLTEPEAQRYKDLMTQQQADPTKFHQYQLPGGENYRELLLTLPKDNASTLVNQRMTQIERVLQNPGDYDTSELNALRTEYRDLATKERDSKQFYSGHYDEPNVLAHVRFNDRVDAAGKKTLFLEEIQSDWHQKGRKAGYQGVDKATDESVSRHGSLVPNAPFKTTWPDLALKRMVKYAVDNGYDSVSWTPGKVQAERYDLSKQIKSLHWNKDTPDGTYSVTADTLDGMRRINVSDGTIPAAKLDDYVGKDVADKIRKSESTFGSLSGVDLRVGGEGMNAFYDKMLPSAANKLGKKYGAKVGVTKIGTGDPKFAEYFKNTYGREPDPEIMGQEVWTLPITDAMRKEVGTRGQPLFTGGQPLGAAAMGRQQQMTPDQMQALMGNRS